jgi:hypothetical protein
MKNKMVNRKAMALAICVVFLVAMSVSGVVNATTTISPDGGTGTISIANTLTKEHMIIQSQTSANIYWDYYHTNSRKFGSLVTELQSAGHVVHVKEAPITLSGLSGCDVLVIVAPSTQSGHELSSSEISAIQSWVSEGHGLFVIGEGEGYMGSAMMASVNQLLSPYSMSMSGSLYPMIPVLVTDFISHPVTAGVNTLNLMYCSELNVAGDSIELGYTDNKEVILAASQSIGRVIVITDSAPLDDVRLYTYDDLTFALNTVDWLAGGGGYPSVSIYTDKTSYTTGDTMHLGLDVANPGDALPVRFALWLELHDGGIYVLTYTSVTLPAGLDYSNSNFAVFTLPSIPAGTYTWHAALIEPSGPIVFISHNTASWDFVPAVAGAPTEDIARTLEQIAVAIDFDE